MFGTLFEQAMPMAIIPFQKVSDVDSAQWGGKAWGLAVMAQAGFPVPAGVILSALPNENEFSQLTAWWSEIGRPPLAVRSSAAAEDSAQTSFAGQNQSFLNICEVEDLRNSIQACFKSSDRPASEAYRIHFKGQSAPAGAMNVVVQEMVAPRFAGVFFSQDPREGKGWLLEVIRGLGEDLVSGKVTPGTVSEEGHSHNLPEGFTSSHAQEVATIGKKVCQFMKFPVDMEWAIDSNNRVFVLQARPITTLNKKTEIQDLIETELMRLRKNHDSQTTWDGQTFAEWNGLPTPFTFSLWREAFSPHHAFGDALRKLGYLSFDKQNFAADDSLLEKIFGRAYINLEKMTELYYGPIPYRIVARPRPHTRFDWRKINAAMIAHMPAAVASMIKVAWNVSSKRRFWLNQSATALNVQRTSLCRPLNPTHYVQLPLPELIKKLQNEIQVFTRETLHWPLLLVVLTEATIQNLRLILGGILGPEASDQRLREWMAGGLHTVTRDMSVEMQQASKQVALRPSFLARYGHRGPGEMDLSFARWMEMGEEAFQSSSAAALRESKTLDVEAAIGELKSFKRDVLLGEWRLFKQLLEHREQWKMEILKPYAEIRFLLEEIGARSGFGSDIHWVDLREILLLIGDSVGDPSSAFSGVSAKITKAIELKIEERKKTAQLFRTFSLPEIVSLEQLATVVDGHSESRTGSLQGEALSPGVAFGVVRFVENPNQVDLTTWPENVILAAVSTDPGWTPLFLKAKGIVAERGGVLSHCAIVAREMSIPAVSGVINLRAQLKDGDRVWVDGNRGQITREGEESGVPR